MDSKIVFQAKGLRVEKRTLLGESTYFLVDPFGSIRVKGEVLLEFCKQIVSETKPKSKPAPKVGKSAEENPAKKEVKRAKKKSES